jgi:hypothetical protein
MARLMPPKLSSLNSERPFRSDLSEIHLFFQLNDEPIFQLTELASMGQNNPDSGGHPHAVRSEKL